MKVTVIQLKHLNKSRSYLKDIKNNLKKSDTWKIQWTIAKNFISSIDNDEGHVMHLKSENMETMINNDEDLKVDIKKS